MMFRNSAILALALCASTATAQRQDTLVPQPISAPTADAAPVFTLPSGGNCSPEPDPPSGSNSCLAQFGPSSGSVAYKCNQDPSQPMGSPWACCPPGTPEKINLDHGQTNTCVLASIVGGVPFVPDPTGEPVSIVRSK